MKLILIRHGATGASGNEYVGRRDLPLNASGVKQAAWLARILVGTEIDRILVSPLCRATETARPIAVAQNVELELRPELVEIDFGILEGRSKAEHRVSIRHSYMHHPIPQGESLEDVANRLSAIVTAIIDQSNVDRTIAVVSHYWTSRVLLAKLRSPSEPIAISHADFKPSPASAFEVVIGQADQEILPSAMRWLVRDNRGAPEGQFA